MRRNAEAAAGRSVEAALSALGSTNRDPCNTYATLLRQCGDSKSYAEGRRVHDHILRNGYSNTSLIAKCLVQMYSKCGNLTDARAAFDSCTNRSHHLWAAIISAYAANGRRREALELYRLADSRGSTQVTTAALAACRGPEDLPAGRAIHRAVSSAGLGAQSDTLLATAIFSMYARCGNLEDARRIFDQMPRRDEVCYTVMISALTQQGQHQSALDVYSQMDADRVVPSGKTFACVLRACSGLRDLALGKEVHRRITEGDVEPDVVLQNALLTMYAKCGELDESVRLFKEMKRKTVATWNAMISAYVDGKLHTEALELYRGMDVHPNAVTFTKILGACCGPGDLAEGKLIHTRVLDCGIPLHTDVMLQNMLVTMYGKCGSVPDAEVVFRNISKKNVYSWTSMVSVYAYHPGRERDAIQLFGVMEKERRVEPDPITYTSVIIACNTVGDLEEGKRIHALTESKGVQSSMVQTALVDLYGKWGEFDEALKVFQCIREKDAVAFTAMVSACVHHDKHGKAVEIFTRMEQEGLEPTCLTYSLVLTACSYLPAFEKGKQIDARVTALGLEFDPPLETALLGLYIRCADLNNAREVFDRLACKSLVSCTAMMAAYNERRHYKEALEIFQSLDVAPDGIAFLHALNACRDLEQGKAVHKRLLESVGMNAILHTAVTDMYVRCGDLAEAKREFDAFEEKDVVSWTSLISAYNQRRYNAEALKLFYRMDLEGVEADCVTYCSVIDSCTGLTSVKHGREIHARVAESGHVWSNRVKEALINMYCKCDGLDDAREVFDSMVQGKTWSSMRTLLGAYAQRGQSFEALKMFNEMNLEGFKVWRIAPVV